MREKDHLNLLLVEDNPADAFLLKNMLREPSLFINEIFEADRLEKAWPFLEENEVHLTILDLSLPDSVGLDSFLSFQESKHRVPVIILTGLADTEVALQAIQAGAKDYLVKGEFNRSILIRAIQYTLERRKLEKEMEYQQKGRQQQITAAVLAAQERERRHVGEELHDNVNQILTSVKLCIATAITEPGSREDLLRKGLEQISLAMEEIRGLSKKMISPGIKTGTLAEHLDNLASDIQHVSGLSLKLKMDIDENMLGESQKIGIYRIIQEQVSNILKHAKATEVSIDLVADEKNVTILTVDNGLGFAPNSSRQGVGITNMISRAEMFNGEVFIDAAPGKGCRIKIVLPLAGKE